MARNKPKDPLKKGLFPIRLGLPLALAVLVGLAALSVVTLIFLKHDTRPEPKPAATAAPANRLTQKIEAPKPAPAPNVPVKAPSAKETAPEPASPAVETPMAAAPSDDPAASETKPAETPAHSTLAAAPSPEASPPAASHQAAATPKTVTEPAKTPEVGAGSHAAPAATPKPESPGEKPAAPGSIDVPKPVWQTVDQNWDKIAVSGPADPGGGETAKWKELEIGQTEKSGQKTGETAKTESATSAKPIAAKDAAPGKETPPAKEAAPTKEAAAVKPAPAKETHAVKEAPKKADPPAKTPSQEPVKAAKAAPERKQPERSLAEPATRKSGSAARDLDLVIVNESGEPGQAEVYRDVLKAMGYPVRTVSEGEQKTGQTTIIYRPGMEAKARSLAERIPGSSNIAPAEDNAPFDIVILVR